MKQNIPIVAAALALAFTSYAACASESSTINQVGTDNIANVEQKANGADDTAIISQGSGSVNATTATATVFQNNGAGSNQAVIIQNTNTEGKGNVAQVQQLDNKAVNAGISQDGSKNTAGVAQTNVNNSAVSILLDQAIIYQNGDKNFGSINQHDATDVVATINNTRLGIKGSENQAYVDQTGKTLSASIDQVGNNNFAVIGQAAVENLAPLDTPQAVIFQSGEYNQGSVHQYYGHNLAASINSISFGSGGDHNQAYIDQTGRNAKSSIEQHDGDHNIGSTAQSGTNNDASIEQSGGSANEAYTTQNGAAEESGTLGNSSMITQSGNRNYAATNQYGNSNMSVIGQVGTHNIVTVLQH